MIPNELGTVAIADCMLALERILGEFTNRLPFGTDDDIIPACFLVM